jgi:hypothetical protein
MPLPPPLPFEDPPPRGYPPDRHNRWWKILFRVLAGSFAGAGATIGGLLVANSTRNPVLGMLPYAFLFIAASFISLRYRRFGYTSGVILAPFITATVFVLLILWSCSHTHW